MAIEVISTIKPKNNGSFPIAEADDIAVDENGTRLSAKLKELASGVKAEVEESEEILILK